MLNFPLPYQDELIYSTVARYGVHFGITSRGQLLTAVFGNDRIKFTTDIPHQLSAIASHLAGCQQYDVEYLAYQHTLLPLYAPFVNEDRRTKSLCLMASGTNGGAAHRLLGMLTSRVKQKALLRYCPQCCQLQAQQHGEYFWRRQWQVNGADCCLAHGELKDATVDLDGYRRHNYTAAHPAICPDVVQIEASPESRLVAEQVEILLNRPPSKSPEMAQWSTFYRNLAENNGIRHNSPYKAIELKRRVLNSWSENWLNKYGLAIDVVPKKSWLQHVFSKHSRSFNYLEHIVTLQALLPGALNISTVLDEVGQIVVEHKKSKVTVAKAANVDLDLRQKYRQAWATLVRKYGLKATRKSNQSMSSWLYSHDRDWLLSFNKPYRTQARYERTSEYWKKLDRLMVRQLLELQKRSEPDLALPQMTRTWFQAQLSYSAFVIKKVSKMPLCRAFFERYCEDVAAYQIRRITRIVIELRQSPKELSRWKLMRAAGCHTRWLKSETEVFLNKIIGI